jgi:hypothetical protein
MKLLPSKNKKRTVYERTSKKGNKHVVSRPKKKKGLFDL